MTSRHVVPPDDSPTKDPIEVSEEMKNYISDENRAARELEVVRIDRKESGRSEDSRQTATEQQRPHQLLLLVGLLAATITFGQTAYGSIPAVPASLAPGTASSPGPTLPSSTVALSWSAPSGATSYGLGVRDIASGTLVVNTTVTSPSYTANLTAGKQYRWNVNACNSAGCSSYAADEYFQTPATVTIPAVPASLAPGTASSPGPTLPSSTVALSWSAPSGATSYGLGVRDIASGTLMVNTTVTSPSYTANLTAGKQYRWNVNACNSAGCSSYAADEYFQTPATVTIPAVPANLAPGTASSPGPTLPSSTVALSWSAPSGATSYGLGVRDIASGTLVVNTTVTSPSYTANLTAGKQYRWNVNACNSAGCSSYAADEYFQTPATVTIPAVPANLAPGTASSPGPTLPSSTVALSWSAPSGATSYGLGVRDIASGTLVVNTTVTSPSYTANLTAGKQYRWNVNACNSAGCSSYAADEYFQTPATVTTPAVPASLAPGTASSPGPTLPSSTVALSWSAPSGATSYGLGVRDIASGTLVVNTTVTSPSYTANLTAGKQYRWNVNACNSAGCSSYAADEYFQTPATVTIPAVPASLAPGTASSPGPTLPSSTVALSWSAPSGATSYGLGVRDIASGTLVVNTTVTSPSYTANLTAGKQYSWNVNACNSAGCSGNAGNMYFQTPATVTTPAVPASLAPGTASSPGPTLPSSTVALSWSAPSGATSYGLGVRDIASGTLVVNTTVTSPSYTANLTAGKQYSWNVNACNSAGCSGNAGNMYFQTPATVTTPAVPASLAPGTASSPGPTLPSSTVALSWSAPSGATSYGLGVRDIASGTLVVNTTVTSPSYTANLTAGKQYRWNVNACNSAGCSSYAADEYFQTPATVTIPAVPASLAPGTASSPGPTLPSSTVALSWSAPSGATSYGLGVRDIASGTLVVNTTVTSPSYTANLTAGKQYSWNVNACNSAGCSGNAGNMYFQTPATVTTPAVPASLAPGTASSPGPTLPSSTVALSWSAPSGATSYGLGVRDIASGTLVVNTTVTSPSYTANLTAGKQYRWNVNACNSAGCSSYAADEYFQTPATVTIPAVPASLAPGTASSPGPTLPSSTVALSWSAPSGATSYGLGVRDIASGTLVVNTTVTSPSYTANLTAGKQYRWNVNACNSAGCSGNAANMYFQTPARATSTPGQTPTDTGFFYPVEPRYGYITGYHMIGGLLPVSTTYGGHFMSPSNQRTDPQTNKPGTYVTDYYHDGYDILADYGQAVYPIADGIVTQISKGGWTSSGECSPSPCTTNWAIVMKHTTAAGQEFRAIYGHIEAATLNSQVSVGNWISAGTLLGKVGTWNLGNHLHFGINLTDVNSPLPYKGEDANTPIADVIGYGRIGIDHWPQGGWPDREQWVDPVFFIETNSPNRLITVNDEVAKSDMKQYLVAHVDSDLVPDDASFTLYSRDASWEYRYEYFYNSQNQWILVVHATDVSNSKIRFVNYANVADQKWQGWFQITVFP